jgi:Fe-S cluster assembly protein SufD
MASSAATLHPPRSDEEAALGARYAALPADARRARAWEAFVRTGLPHRRVEGWRWSDVRAALRTNAATGETPADPFAAVGGAVLTFSGRQFAPPAARPAGVRISERKGAPALNSAEELPLAALAVALADQPASIDIEIGASPSEPIRLVFTQAAGETFRHVLVLVREGAEAHVLESHLAGGGFSNVVVEYVLEQGAVLNRTVAQVGASGAVQAATASVRLGQNARLVQTSLALGARLARLETRVVHEVAGSDAILNGAYLAGAGFHADLTSHVRHSSPGAVTRQTVKGAARAGGKGVFQGKFFVARDAQKTDAQMEHHALLLEDGAEINAKPELEIYADDVQCAHGNTAGAIDEEALFYIRQRGVPEHEARAMLTQSFIAEAFAAADPKVADILLSEAQRWLLQAP